ncbi:DnaJ domain-containing protein [Sarocladium implicatum]|nr:DnaJ domain-containing protein [Sarocladium implicatum]
MTDTSFSSNSLRIQRGRTPSGQYPNRNSTYQDDNGSLRLPGGLRDDQPNTGGGHSLRSQSSRFSLSEHFAATRSLYEFGFDDASSYAAPSILGAEDKAMLLEGKGLSVSEEEEASDEELRRRSVEALLEGDFYDVLCLPREPEALTMEEARRAYHRMFLLFYPETYPMGMQGIARKQFERAQEGFEVLMIQARRARDAGDDEVEEEAEMMGTETDVGVRVDVRTKEEACRPLDFNVGHAASFSLPSFNTSSLLHRLGWTSTTSTLSLFTSIYGIVPPMSLTPLHILSSTHQPLHPTTSPRHRLLQLVEGKLSPQIGARLSHDVTREPPSSSEQRIWLGTHAEYGLDVLPDLTPSLRLFHRLNLDPSAASSSSTAIPATTILETSIRGRPWLQAHSEGLAPPRAAMAVHHPLSFGTAFARVDTGDWSFAPEAYRFLASEKTKELRYVDFPLSMSPTVELGISNDGLEGGARPWTDAPEIADDVLTSGQTSKPIVDGVWSASTTLGPVNSLTTSLRYTTAALPSLSSCRFEIDLTAGTSHPSNLSFRQLFPLSSSMSLGLELSVSRFSTHVSLHVSRLGRRFSLPLLLPPLEHIQPLKLFVASAAPFLALAVYKFQQRRRRRISGRKPPEQLDSMDASSPIVQAAIARRREEADHLTGLLAHPIATRQKHHASVGGLVILSAKLGVLENPTDEETPHITLNGMHPSAGSSQLTFHPDEEVADVTVALAALVDDHTGGLCVPRGVRKGCIPGFWDPAPAREKLLLVRYSWKGKEAVVAVKGEEELVLPPKR